jgi:maleate isomerase
MIPATPWRRVGMLIPSSNTSIEREYPQWMPAALSFHFARLTMTRLDAAGMTEQLADMQRATASLRDGMPRYVATSPSGPARRR